MRQTLLSVLSLLVSMAFLMMGSGALATVIGLRMAEANWSSLAIGVVSAAFYLGLLTGTGFAQRLIAGAGHIRAFAAFASMFSATALFHGLHTDAYFWFALRFVSGVCLTGLFMCVESWLNERSENAIRGQVFALYQAVVSLALGMGQFLINVPDETGFVIYVIASAVLSLAVIPIALTRVQAPPPPPNVRYRLRDIYGISPLGMIISFAAGALLGAIFGLGPVFSQKIGLTTGETSILMGAVSIGGLALQYPIGKLSDLFDRRRIILVCAVITAFVCLALIPGEDFPRLALYVLTGIFGGLIFIFYPLAVSYTNDYLEASDMVPASAGLLMAYGLGATLGPLTASGMMEATGPSGLFLFCAVVSGGMAGFALYRMTQRSALPAGEQADFQSVTTTTYMAAELDPRSEWDLTGEVDEDGAVIPRIDEDDQVDDTALLSVTGGITAEDLDPAEGSSSSGGARS